MDIEGVIVMVGRIEYLYSGGIGETVEYEEADKLVKDVYEDNHYGVPMTIVIYSDENGPMIPISAFANLDCMAANIKVE